MNKVLLEHLRGFEDKYPHLLDAKFPRTVETIAELWDKPDVTRYFAKLLIKNRVDGQEFPHDIAREIFLLSVAYDEIHNQRLGQTDVWNGEWNAARRAIERLNIRASCLKGTGFDLTISV